MLAYALMLDGGFIKRKFGGAQKPCTAEDIVVFTDKLRRHELLKGHRLHRIYFYDAAPSSDVVDKPFSTDKVDFGATSAYQANSKLHANLAREDYFANRLGELSFNGWVSKKDLRAVKDASYELTAANIKPNITQKGVDMRIGLDMASLTLKKLSSVIVLVTGDSDFVPAMKFARREGAQLILVTLGHAVKEAMYHHADVVINDSAGDWLAA
jgi:uncharacterized LabA/DUF88 family protein